MQPTIRLYSASPRRRELLERVGIPFLVMPVDADETIPEDLEPVDVVKTIALRKLEVGLDSGDLGTEGAEARANWGLAADTLVEGPSGLLGKPANAEEAARMISSLSGRPHRVHSAFALYAPERLRSSAEIQSGVHTTIVEFRSLEEDDVASYVETGEWKGAAGGYRIQGKGELLVKEIRGLWSTVVGLPLGPLYGILSELSYPLG